MIVLAAVCLCVAGVGVYLYVRFTADCVAKEGSVYVPTGDSFEGLIDSLERDGMIKDMGRFRKTASLLGLESVRSGHYVLKKGMGYNSAVRMFQRGFQTPVKVTFNNIRTLPQLAGRIGAQLESDSVLVAGVLTADSSAARYGFDRRTFMAMFIPNTYEFYWNVTTVAFLDRMSREYEAFWNEDRCEKLRQMGMSRVEAVTLASIVYEETKMGDEMPAVAGVYVNRLRIGMPLQADPTVKFAVGDFTLKRILNKHSDIDSPYNTYRNAGLPPGPICMPSVKAIDAVLNYDRHKYLYFCARADFSGYHSFAVTLAEHNRNAAAYHRALDARGIR